MHAFVPADRAEVADMRVLLAWIELGRADDSLGPVIDRYRSDERLLLGVRLTRLMSPDRQRYLDESELERAHVALDFYVAQWLESAVAQAEAASARARSSATIRSGSSAE